MKFNDYLNQDKPVLVDFFAVWCGPCKMMTPILEQLKKKVGDKADVIKVDVDKNPKVSIKYQIQSVPTLILFKKGLPVWRKSGVSTADELEKIILKYQN